MRTPAPNSGGVTVDGCTTSGDLVATAHENGQDDFTSVHVGGGSGEFTDAPYRWKNKSGEFGFDLVPKTTWARESPDDYEGPARLSTASPTNFLRTCSATLIATFMAS